MSAKNIAAFGIYTDPLNAMEAADALKRIGFRGADISILVPDNLGTKDFGHEKHTKAPEGAAIGAAAGVLLGACLGWLVSANAFSNVSWLDQLKALGPAGAVLSGIGALTIVGLLIGALFGSTVPEYEAIRYEGRTRRGGVLLSTHCDNQDWTKRAEDILRQTGAKEIAVRREAKADFGASEKPLPRTRTTSPLDQLRRDPVRTSEMAELEREDLESHAQIVSNEPDATPTATTMDRRQPIDVRRS
jgi:hypothetical protein